VACQEPNPKFDGPADGAAGTGTETSAGTETSETNGSEDETKGSEDTGERPGPCEEADSSMVACYDFETTQGNVFVDGSMYGNDAALSNANLGPGHSGNAYDVGPTSRVVVDDSPSLDINGPLTIEGWLRLRSLPAPGERQGVMDNEGQYAVFIYPPDELRCQMGFDDVSATVDVLDEWTHFACVYDGNELRAYLNAELVDTLGGSGTIGTDDTTPMSLGNAAETWDAPLDGLMDSFRIWNVGLQDEEVCKASGIQGC
jgi:hypothetical protein